VGGGGGGQFRQGHFHFPPVLHLHGDRLTDEVVADDFGLPFRQADSFPHFGQVSVEFLVRGVFVSQAAHETAADAGDLAGIEAELLLFGHAHGHGLEVLEEVAAAQGPAADAQAPHHPGPVAHADLSELDAGAELLDQFLHQFPEIYPARGGEVEDELGGLKEAVDLHQIDGELAGLDATAAELCGPLFQAAILLVLGQVPRGSQPHQLFGFTAPFRGVLVRENAVHPAQDQALFGFHHHQVPEAKALRQRGDQGAFPTGEEADLGQIHGR
jgi:hypothetical protein